MKKYLIIILILLAQVILAGNSRFENRELFSRKVFQNNNTLSGEFVHIPSALTPHYPVACRWDKKLVLSYAGTVIRGEGWDLFDINILGLMEGYINPEAFFTLSVFLDINTISDWDRWDGWLKHVITGSTMGSFYRYNYRLNNSGNLLEYLQEFMENDTSDWVNEINMTFEYTTGNKVSSQIIKVWDQLNSMWGNNAKISFLYDGNNRVTEAVIFAWSPDSNDWLENIKSVYTYDGAGKIIKINRYSKNQDLWDEYSRNEFRYTNGKITEYINYDYDLPEFSQKITFNYNTSNKVLSYTGYSLNPVDSSWLPSLQYSISYNTSGEMSQIIIQEMDTLTSTWVNSINEIFNYNSDKNMIDEIALLWDDGANDWVNAFKLLYTYNSRKNPNAYFGYEWNVSSDQWESSGDSATILYEYTNSIIPNNHILSTNDFIQVKKSTGAIRVSVKGEPGKNDIMKVYDLQGRIVYSAKPVYSEEKTLYSWDISGKNKIPAKVYLFCIQRSDNLIKQRIIISR